MVDFSDEPPPALSDAFLDGLAPAPLENERPIRSHGDERAIRLADLGEDQRQVVRRLYEELGRLEGAPARAAAPSPPEAGPGVPLGSPPGAPPVRATDLVGLAHRLGRGAATAAVAEVLHDVRSGPLTSLVVALDRAAAAPEGPDARRFVALLARDHRKLMRSALVDLDPGRRRHDLEFRLHHVGRLLDAVRAPSGPVGQAGALTIDCRFEGALTACCSELGALERVFYNLLNKAARHASAARLWLLPQPARDPHDLRVVVANAVAPARREALAARFAGGLEALLTQPRSAPAAPGLGLRICAELVADAYGLAEVAESARGGYVGAGPVGDAFVAWFHWPVVRPGG